MNRKRASQPKQTRSEKSRLRDLHGSPKKDVAVRRRNRIKQMDVEQNQELFSSDPEPLCSGSNRSILRRRTNGPGYVDQIPAHNRAVTLSNDGEEEMEQLEPKAKWKHSNALEAFLPESRSTSHSGFERQLSGSVYEESMTSGPSSPCAQNSHRCSECERLFSRMKKKAPLKNKKRSADPASLSCDEWLLKKIWRPQRKRQVRGRLWVHLRWIRHRVKECTGAAEENTPWSLCSRPHVFLQRNLRRCREESSMRGRLSESKVKLAKHAIPLSSKNRKTKKKSSEKDGTFLGKTVIQSRIEDKLAAKNDAYHQGLQQQENALKKTSVSDSSSFLVTQTSCIDLTGTGRVEAFHAPYCDGSMETLQHRQSLEHTNPRDKICEDHANFPMKNCPGMTDNVLTGELDGLWTSADQSNVEFRTRRKNQATYSRGLQMDSFRSKLAALDTSCNRIIKESHR